MSSPDSSPPALEELLAQNRSLRQRVADLERELKRFDASPTATLRESMSEREALLLEAERIAHMGTWVWDVPRDDVFWSPELFRIFGCDPDREPASAERFFGCVHPDDRERVRQVSARGIETGISEPVDYRILRPDGEVRHVTMEGALLFDGDGTLRRAVGTVLDVTDARAAAAELERTAKVLAEAQRIGKMGSFEADVQNGTDAWSPELYRLLDVDPDTPPGPEALLSRLHPEDVDRIRGLVRAALEQGEVTPSHARAILRDGSVRHLEMTAIPVFADDGSLTHIRGTVNDVTDVVRLREQLAQSQKMEAIGQLAGGIAHDFNNLLTIILGNLHFALSRRDDSDLREVERAASTAASLTSRLLAFSRRSMVSPRLVDLSTDLAGVREIVERAIGDHIDTHFETEEGLGPIRADPGQIEQMILNLAVNARDAMPDGGKLEVIARSAELSEAQADRHHVSPGDYVTLTVTDTGSGMPEEVVTRVFEPFFTTKEPGQGTGLGLAMVFGAMQQSGGFAEVSSTLGQGSQFRLWFPRARGRVPTPVEAAEPELPKGARVLLVEDNAAVASTVRRMLTVAGLEVRVAHRPSEALKVDAGAADLLITDVVMPEMTGPELVAALRRDHPALRVLYITGYSEEHAALGDLPEGTLVLTKPFGLTALRRALFGLLAHADVECAGSPAPNADKLTR